METRRVTTVRQLEMLVAYMRDHKDLALGRVKNKEGRATALRLMGDLSLRLNPEGPKRTPKEWTKVWNDLKSKVKLKIISIRKGNTGTGGGPNNHIILTPIEDQVAAILGRDCGYIDGVNVEGQVEMNNDIEGAAAEHDERPMEENLANYNDPNNSVAMDVEIDYCESLDHDYIGTSQRPNSASPSQRPNSASPSQRPNSTASPSQRPNSVASSSQRPNLVAGSSRRPNPFTINSQRPNSTASPSQRPNSVASSSQRSNSVAGPSHHPEPLAAGPAENTSALPHLRTRRTIRPRRPRSASTSAPERVAETTSLSQVHESMARIELLRAETSRDLAATAALLAQAAATQAEAAMEQARATSRHAEATVLVANSIKAVADNIDKLITFIIAKES